jgi:hypothetical protein
MFIRFAKGLLVLTFLGAQLQAQTGVPVPTNPTPAGVDLSALAEQPATHTGFTFDRAQLQSLLQAAGFDAAASLNSITFDTYHYREPAIYMPETMSSVVQAYQQAGWKHLVGKQSAVNTVQPQGSMTDLWLHYTGSDVDRVTVLIRSPKDVNVIQVAGDLRPLDLVHLGGHLGIPKVDPNAVMVAAPDGK